MSLGVALFPISKRNGCRKGNKMFTFGSICGIASEVFIDIYLYIVYCYKNIESIYEYYK